MKDGSYGIALETNQDVSTVMFLNFKNHGDYCIREVGNYALEYVQDLPEDFALQIKNKIQEFDIEKKNFETSSFEQFDNVMLINEKAKYLKEGLEMGDIGMLNSEYAILGKWEVMFPKNHGDICMVVDEKDLKKI